MNPRNLRIVLALIALIVVVSIAAVVVFIVATNRTALNPFEAFVLRVQLNLRDAELSRTVTANSQCFTIQSGETATSIGTRLQQQGLITDAALFRNYMRYSGLDRRIQAATYPLPPNPSIVSVANAFANPGLQEITLRIIEGWRIEQIAQLIDTIGTFRFTGSDFLAAAQPTALQPEFVAAFAQKYQITPRARTTDGRNLFLLEGFLYPATYQINPCATVNETLQTILNGFDSNVTGTLSNSSALSGLTPEQVVSLAAIVEREAVVEDERPTIASVYLNRYRNFLAGGTNTGIPQTLDADPTIQYALGNTRDPNTWWPQITQADYRSVQSLFNTYLNTGLPPNPIANPRASSIAAVIEAPRTDYVYFRASCAGDGRHRFARTFAEQLANAC